MQYLISYVNHMLELRSKNKKRKARTAEEELNALLG